MDVNGNVVISAVYLVLWFLFSASYCFCLATIYLTESLWEMPCYRIMFTIGVSDVNQVFVLGFATALLSLLGVDVNGYDWLAKIFGAWLLAHWFAAGSFTVLLAFNRFLTISAKPSLVDKLFANRQVYIWLGVIYCHGAAVFMALLLPGVDVAFYSDNYIWFYGNSSESIFMENYNIVFDAITAVLVVGFTGGTLVQLWVRLGAVRQGIRAEEKRAVLPAVIVAVTLIFNDLYFYVSPNLSTDWWTVFFTNMTWMVWVGITGSLIMTFNRSVKHHAKMLMLRVCGRHPVAGGKLTNHPRHITISHKGVRVNPSNSAPQNEEINNQGTVTVVQVCSHA